MMMIYGSKVGRESGLFSGSCYEVNYSNDAIYVRTLSKRMGSSKPEKLVFQKGGVVLLK